MNYKAIVGTCALLIILGLLAGCAKTGGQSNNGGNQAEVTGFGQRRPDFGQPERPADISGLVKSVTGNSVTILKIDRPGRMASSSRETREGESGENGERPQGNFMMGSGGGRMMGGAGGVRPGGMDEESRAEMVARLKEMSSGEVTVTIPVGIKMLKPDTASADGSRQPAMAEATLTDIAADKMLSVWTDRSVTDRSVAEFVLITR